ncbi:MAG: hypothetical protein J6C64_12885 [Lachnospiraceae bacterium]|nr:hypothetical protein [Lachnospiraceae bacterium]
MDAIYPAIKNLLKSFVNLFVAVVELFAGLINGVASLFLKLRPEKFVLKGKNAGEKLKMGKFAISGKIAADEELVCKVRNELKEKITDRNKYILAKAEVEIFENSRIRSAFAGRRKKLTYAVTGILLEEEFRGMFQDGLSENETGSIMEGRIAEKEVNAPESIVKEELPAEKAKIQSICEVGKEAIS